MWALALGLVFAAALGLRLRGGDWPNLHPDRYAIGRWIEWTADHPYLQDRAYPGGFFTLFRPVYQVARIVSPVFREERRINARSPDKSVQIRHAIALARGFNAWLGALTVLAVYVFAFRITGSRPGAFAAAWLMAFAPFHIEHCHYAETDIAMVFLLSVTLWLGVRARDLKGFGPLGSAAVVAGFAAGTKFPLVLLAAVLLPAAISPAGRWATLRRAGGALLAFAAGFLLANPILLFEPGLFFHNLKIASGRLMVETRQVLGNAADLPGAQGNYQARWLWLYLGAEEGRLALLVCGLGLPFLLSRRARAYAPWTLLFPALLTLQLIFFAPWIRVQETLNYLPVLTGWFGGAWAGAAGCPRRCVGRAWRWGLAGLMALAGLHLVQSSLLRVSLFTWKDTRFLAQAWLQRHYPQELPLGLDFYTKTVEGVALPVAHAAPAPRIEKAGIAALRDRKFAYLLRNTTTPGKGLFDPFTGRLYPAQQANLAEFERSAELIRVWSPAPPETPASFAFVNSELQLYGLRTVPRGLDLHVPIQRPIYRGEDHDETFFPVGHDYGSAHEIVLRRKRKEIAVGGPGRAGPPVFLVVMAPEGPLRLTIRGYGRMKRLDLPAGGVQVVYLERPWWSMRTEKFDRIRFKKNAPADGEGRVRVCFNMEEVVTVLLEARRPDLAEEWLRRRPVGGSAGKILSALTAWQVETLAEDFHAQRELAVRNLEHIASMPVDAYRINGMSGLYYNDFARMKLTPDVSVPGAGPALLSAPVTLPSGRWHVVLDLRLKDRRGEGRVDLPNDFRVTDAAGEPMRNIEVSRIGANRRTVEFDWVTAETKEVKLRIAHATGVDVACRELLISWTLADRLRALAADLVSTRP